MKEEASRPTVWPELRAKLASDPRAHALDFAYFIKEIRNSRDKGRPWAMERLTLYDATAMLCRGVAMGQGGFMARPAAQLLAWAREMVAEDSTLKEDLRTWPLTPLAIFALAEGLGEEVKPEEPAGLLDELRALEMDDEVDTLRIAWASLAWGRADGLRPFLFTEPAAQPPDPATQELRGPHNSAIFLARCMLHDAGEDLLMQAFHNYLHQLPLNLDTGWASWPELLWAARAVHAVALGRPPGELGKWLGEVAAAA